MEVLHRSFALFDKVFFLLDALDECESDKLRELYAALEEMYGWNLPCTHFLITSRKDGSILEALEGIVPRQSRLEFSRDAVDEDIRAWLEDELAHGQLGSKIDRWQEPDSLKTRITTELMKRASGMFLLTRLQTEELVTCCNEHDIDEALHDMPDSLGGMYDRVLARITGRSKQQYARNVFTWMMYARRTLCVEELEWAIAFPENDQSELVLDPRMRMQDGANEVFRICWSLVTVIEPAAGSRKRFATVELAHSTVKEHLISSTWDRSATPWFSALRPIPSRRLMAQSLLSYLWYISQLPRAENHYSRTSWQYSLTWYAVQAWPEHANMCGAVAQPFDPSDPLHRLMQKLIQDATAMETLVKRLEPHMDSAQDIRKTLQDLQIIWYHTSLMRLGTLVKGSLPLSTCLYPRGPRRWMVRSAVNSIGDKLGTSTHGGESLFQTSRESEDAAVPPRDGNVLRELFREANHGWESQPFLELDLPQVGKEKGFRGSASVLRKVWVDNELDVAIVKIRDPTWSIALFPVVMHTSLFRGVR